MTGQRIVSGIVASLAGGIVFGIVMQMMGSIKMIAGIVGSDSVLVGWGIHIMISAIFGVTWLAFAGENGGWLRGLIYGIVVWVFGPLIVMPMMFRIPLFQINQAALMSLLGHLMYGALTGLVFSLLAKGQAASQSESA